VGIGSEAEGPGKSAIALPTGPGEWATPAGGANQRAERLDRRRAGIRNPTPPRPWQPPRWAG
jgi:hypothetical protein